MSNLNEIIKAEGIVGIRLYDEHNNLKECVHVKNLVVQTGRDMLAQLLNGQTPTTPSHMAIGTGTTPESIVDTTLETETVRVAFDSNTINANIVTFAATYAPGVGTGAITEAGTFNDPTAGTMFSHTVFPVLNKQAGDTMVLTWVITIS